MECADVVVIGAGFGGMAAALTLAEQGARVRLLEALPYPGGCASTFTRKRVRYEAGATLFSGLREDQLFGRWIRRWELPVTVDWLDPVVETRAPGVCLLVDRQRDAFVERLCRISGSPAEDIRHFFRKQRKMADLLWELFDDPSLLPPFRFDTLGRHLSRTPRYLHLLPWLLRPMSEFAGPLMAWAPFRAWLSGVCQITVQCEPPVAEAVFAIASMDYCWRGTGHIRGGIGELAKGMVTAIGRAGGATSMSDRVTGLQRIGGQWQVDSRKGVVRAPRVVANLLPRDLAQLGAGNAGVLEARHRPVAGGWGAVMLYRVVRAEDGPAHHLDLTRDPDRPLSDGNHVFLSVGATGDARGVPSGQRVLTASTHVALSALREIQPLSSHRIQQQMRATITALAPEWDDVIHEMTASPRTFQKFVRRAEGAVGGVPRQVGLHAWSNLGPESPFLGYGWWGTLFFRVRAHLLPPWEG